MTTFTRKRLLIFCDGTGQDGLRAEKKFDANAAAQAPAAAAAPEVPKFTNVLRLSRAVLPFYEDPNTGETVMQIVFYQNGVGADSDFKGDAITGTDWQKASGTGVATKIRDVYAFIAQNYIPGDEIFLFGFSRGAYTVRKAAGLIHRIGLLDRKEMGQFFNYWRMLVSGEQPEPPPPSTPIPIECIGVWDTVGSVYPRIGNPLIDALNIKDASLQPTVKRALHAVAFHENRDLFMCTLWEPPSVPIQNQVLKQVVFAGAHSDVGGGYPRYELADISLFWMASEVQDIIALDESFLLQCMVSWDGKPAWGESQPHNAYKETSQIVIRAKTRLDGEVLKKDSQYHSSVEKSPLKLDSPTHMITLDSLRKAFGQGWSPDYVGLNELEQKAKKIWGEPLLHGAAHAPTFESIEEFTRIFDVKSGDTLKPKDETAGGV